MTPDFNSISIVVQIVVGGLTIAGAVYAVGRKVEAVVITQAHQGRELEEMEQKVDKIDKEQREETKLLLGMDGKLELVKNNMEWIKTSMIQTSAAAAAALVASTAASTAANAAAAAAVAATAALKERE